MSTKIKGLVNEADVTSNSQLKVTTETDASAKPQHVGAIKIFSENDNGDISGNVYLKSPETSPDYRLRIGQDSIWDNENFNYAAQNTSKHSYLTTNIAIAYGGGSITTNSGLVTTLNSGAILKTYRNFPILGTAGTNVDFDIAIVDPITTNTEVYYGLYTPGTQIQSPTDGAYFKITSAGFFGCINNSSSETAQLLSFVFDLNKTYRITISLNHKVTEFWIDDVLYASIATPIALGMPCSALSQPLCIQHRILGTASGATFRTKCFNYNVTIGDIDNNRLWPTAMVGMGGSSIQGQSGHVQAQTSNNVNSTAPVNATIGNTAAGYTTMGGQFSLVGQTGAELDICLFAYLNPIPTLGISGKNLIIRGITIETFNMGAAVANTPTLLQWSLGVGSTAVSLATAEGAASRAPRRLNLGTQVLAIGTVVGGQADRRIDVNLDAPVNVEPGTYLHIILKIPVGTATASQVIRGIVGVNGYWE